MHLSFWRWICLVLQVEDTVISSTDSNFFFVIMILYARRVVHWPLEWKKQQNKVIVNLSWLFQMLGKFEMYYFYKHFYYVKSQNFEGKE